MNHLIESEQRILKTKELIEAELNRLKNNNVNDPTQQVDQIAIDISGNHMIFEFTENNFVIISYVKCIYCN